MVSEVYAGAIKAEMLNREEKNPLLAKSKRKTMRFLDDSIDKKLNKPMRYYNVSDLYTEVLNVSLVHLLRIG
jgi:hypothetical protein